MTARHAWFLADRLGAGSYPWKLAITVPFADPAQRNSFNQQCLDELLAQEILDDQGRISPALAESIQVICNPRQWLEWLTIIDQDRVLRGVMARSSTSSDRVVVALRYAQMVTFTPLQLTHSEAVVPIITTGLPDQPPARFDEFMLPMDTGKAIDTRIARGADVVDTLIDLGVPERDAQVMEVAHTGTWATIELTAHEALNGARHQTDVCVNLLNTDAGRIVVSPPADEPRAGGQSVFAPGDAFTLAMAVRDLTARLPAGVWFPEESFSI